MHAHLHQRLPGGKGAAGDVRMFEHAGEISVRCARQPRRLVVLELAIALKKSVERARHAGLRVVLEGERSHARSQKRFASRM